MLLEKKSVLLESMTSLESGSYDSNNGNLNQWDLAMFDVQTTTEIALNQSHTLQMFQLLLKEIQVVLLDS